MNLSSMLFFGLMSVIQHSTKYKLDFHTDYNQFYLFDKGSPGQTDSFDFWTKDAFDGRLAVEKGVLGIGTQTRGHIRGELFILDSEKHKADCIKFDHVVEGSIEIKSGILQILDCPNSTIELEITLNPGTYRVRIYSANLRVADGDEVEGTDRYEIDIWPALYTSRKVIKQFKNN
jgi:hypothetical protein